MNIKRRNLVNECIQDKGEITIKQLEEIFSDVSSMTLRRDLAYLEEKGEIVRTWGGAKSIAHLSGEKEEAYNLRETENIKAKQKIAKKAVKFIETGRSIFLDSGTTVMCLAKEVPDKNLSILTSGPNIAMEMSKKNSPTINVIGGQLNRDNLSISGFNSLEFIKTINIDIAFMATSGFSLEVGFTSGNFNECELKKAIIDKARKVILLMDLSKLDKNLPFTFAKLSDIDILICENKLPNKINDLIKDNEVEVY